MWQDELWTRLFQVFTVFPCQLRRFRVWTWGLFWTLVLEIRGSYAWCYKDCSPMSLGLYRRRRLLWLLTAACSNIAPFWNPLNGFHPILLLSASLVFILTRVPQARGSRSCLWKVVEVFRWASGGLLVVWWSSPGLLVVWWWSSGRGRSRTGGVELPCQLRAGEARSPSPAGFPSLLCT